MHSVSILAAALLSLTSASASAASGSGHKVLDAEAYERWNDLTDPVLSPDGRWVAYTLYRGDGAQELVVHSTQSAVELRTSRGMVPRGSYPYTPTRFTAGSRHVVFAITPPVEHVSLRADDWHPFDSMHGLGILSLPDGAVTKVAQVSSFSMPRDSGRYLAYVLRHDPSANSMKTRDALGHTLVLRDLSKLTQVRIPNVQEFVLDDQGRFLAYTVASEEREANGTFVRRLSDGHVMALLTGAGSYRSLAFDMTHEQLAFLSDRAEHGEAHSRFSLYHSSSPYAAAQPVVLADALKEGWVIDAHAGVKFTPSGNALTFSVRSASGRSARPLQSSATHETKLDLWHWRDPGERPGRRWRPSSPAPVPSYAAVYRIGERQWFQLATALYPWVLFSDKAQFALGIDEAPYRLQNRWAGKASDLYMIDVSSAAARLLRRGVAAMHWVKADQAMSEFSHSPTGRYVVYFEDLRWWSVDLQEQKVVDLTGSLLPDVSFGGTETLPFKVRETLPFGIAGWTERDRRVLLYSQHDIWEIDPAGVAPPRSITERVGERDNIVFRLWDENHEVVQGGWPILKPGSPLLLTALDRTTMASGIWRAQVGASTPPKRLLMLGKRITPVAQARWGQQYLLTMETFSEYPNLWTGSRFDQLARISDANPQQREYRWGKAELVEFTSDFGVPLKGRLYTPEGFNPTQKYPMIVNLYQIASHQLHLYSNPAPLDNAVVPQFTAWPTGVSNGYIYFVPDVESRAPYPVQSAVAAVVPAVRSILNRGFVDPERIGLMGHSFGAFEANAILTQTNLFRCAVTTSGSTDKISYHGHLDGFGNSYTEISQGRQGGSIWERPYVYIANSLLMHADRLQTPLLFMHNELDNAVPLSQGMGLFFALQRNGKPVWLIRYRGEGHVLHRYANRLDWDRRVTEFFDHHLKDAPLPAWMRPHSDKPTFTPDHISQLHEPVSRPSKTAH